MRETDAGVAIVGIGCRIPPAITGAEGFWRFMLERGDAVRDITADRWQWAAFYDPDTRKPGKTNVHRAALLEQPIEAFDASFFGVSPREAAQLDPQQRLLLEVSWEALEDAGCDVWALRGSRTGVFVGTFMLDNAIQRTEPAAREDIVPQTALTCTNTVLASRLSYFYDFRGPAMAIDTACSSSLVALHQAVRSLQDGECDTALVGGVNRIFRPEAFLLMSKGQLLAPDGRSKAFSSSADGYGRGEGCGVVVLKPLSAAQRDGDRVYAVIEATGVNQDGRTVGPALPSAEAQAELIRSVTQHRGIDPASIVFVEAHGTGTLVGDPAEMKALGEVIGRAAGRERPCVVGSVKSGIGHLESAAGVTGLIKAALVAQRGVVPPQAWLEELNPAIDFDGLGLAVATDAVTLEPATPGLRVAVNSFGYGGTNAHAVLREPRHRDASPDLSPVEGYFEPVLPLSAHSLAAVATLAGQYPALLEGVDSLTTRRGVLARIGARTAHEHRVVIAGPATDFAARLEDLARGEPHPDIATGRAIGNRVCQPVLVFSGMGPQWWGMGRDLLGSNPLFRRHVEECDWVFSELAGWSLVEEMSRPHEESQLATTAVAQPANFALQTGIAAVLRDLGVAPAAAVGHSVGEVAAAYVAGCLSLEDALTVVHHRSRLQAATAGIGGMLATGLGEDVARDLIAEIGPGVSLAAINAPDATTLAGDVPALEALAERLSAEGVFCRVLNVEVAYHSPSMDPILPELVGSLAGITPCDARTSLVSTVSADDDSCAWGAEYWARNAREPVDFHGAATRLVEAGHRLFVEVGPHPVLSVYLHQLLGSAPGAKVVPTLRRGRPDRESLSDTLTQLWLHGTPISWAGVLGPSDSTVALPAYPWQREHHWQEPPAVRRQRTGETDHADVLSGQLTSTSPDVWDIDLAPALVPWGHDHRVDGAAVFPAAGFVEAIVSHARQANSGALPVVIEQLEIAAPMVLAEHQDSVLRLTTQPDGTVTLRSRRRGHGESWLQHATARLGRASYQPTPREIPRGQLSRSLVADDIYRRFEEIGLDYRGSFRSVVEVRDVEGIAVTDVELGTQLPEGYTLFPPLLDAGIHGSLGPAAARADDLFLPVRIGRVVVHGPLPAAFHVQATPSVTAPDRVVADLAFHAPDGRCVAEFMDVELRAVRRIGPEQSWLDQRSFELRWFEANDLEHAEQRPAPGRWVACAVDDAVFDALVASLPNQADIERLDKVEGLLDTDLDGVGGIVVALSAGDLDASIGEACFVAEQISQLIDRHEGSVGLEIVFVTSQAVAVVPSDRAGGWSSSWIVGFRRVAANELGRVRIRHIDHGGASPEGLARAFLAHDEEIAVRGDELYRPQLRSLTSHDADRTWWQVAADYDAQDVENFALVSTGTSLEDLVWERRTRRPPEAGEVELRVEAVGLNYKDLVKHLGFLDPVRQRATFIGANLGMEACVVVERVGPNVANFRPGERYIATIAGGCFSRYLTRPVEDLRLAAPSDKLTNIDCAAASVAFGTAHTVLTDLARLQVGENVLVHSATGAVGLAAIQVAKRLGATIRATAGNDTKRQYLRDLGVAHVYDSRTHNFVRQVLADTDGRGVDVIVNTLPGDGLRANLEAAADNGRVIDISKQEILSGSSLPLAPFDKNLSLISFDLDRLAGDPARSHALGVEVMSHVDAGDYQAIPTTVFPAAGITAAFTHFARAEHIGKVVIDLTDQHGLGCRQPQPHDATRSAVRDDRLYVISGGTGAIGLQAARWLTDRGAGKLLLLSRRGYLDEAGQHLVDTLRSRGADITVAAADIADQTAVARCLADARQTAGAPIGGVIHAAGIGHNRPMVQMTAEDASVVLDPKLRGALALHHSTLDDPIDFFLVTSSVAALNGITGQGTYSAANSALDAFAEWRRRQGLPACSVALGPVADIGMAAATPEVARYLQLLGFTPLPVDKLCAIFNRALAWNRPVLTVFELDWQTWATAEPHAASHRFARILATAGANSTQGSDIWASIAALPEDKRITIIVEHLIKALATALDADPTDLDPETPITTLGLDSLSGLEIQTQLNQTLGTHISLMDIVAATTIHDVATAIDTTQQPGRPS